MRVALTNRERVLRCRMAARVTPDATRAGSPRWGAGPRSSRDPARCYFIDSIALATLKRSPASNTKVLAAPLIRKLLRVGIVDA